MTKVPLYMQGQFDRIEQIPSSEQSPGSIATNSFCGDNSTQIILHNGGKILAGNNCTGKNAFQFLGSSDDLHILLEILKPRAIPGDGAAC